MYVCTCMLVCVHVSVVVCECVCLCSRVCVCELLGEKLTLVFVRAHMVMEPKPLMKVLVVNKEKVNSLQFGKFSVHQCSFMPQLTKFLNSVILQSSPLSFPHCLYYIWYVLLHDASNLFKYKRVFKPALLYHAVSEVYPQF